jgi:Mrp family chromosome partitioning ATPase
MSHFFRALEQAERDRALREQQRRTAAPPGKAPAAPDTTMRSPAPPPASTAVSDVEPPSAAAVTAPPAPARVERERAVPPPRVAELRRRRDTALDVEPSRPEDEREVNPEIDPHLVSLLAPASLAAEHYRVLAHVVEQRRRLDDVVVVAVTSPAAGDGKSVTAANLAGALAHQPGGRVLLV